MLTSILGEGKFRMVFVRSPPVHLASSPSHPTVSTLILATSPKASFQNEKQRRDSPCDR
jgi:hypothetical protein